MMMTEENGFVDEDDDFVVEEADADNQVEAKSTFAASPDPVKRLEPAGQTLEVVNLWRQVASNALGFLRGYTDRMATTTSSVLLTEELMEQFKALQVHQDGTITNEAVLLGLRYNLLPEMQRHPVKAYEGTVRLDEVDHDYSVTLTIDAAPTILKTTLMERLAQQPAWSLIADSQHSTTWRHGTSVFLVFIPAAGILEVRAGEEQSAVANAIIVELRDVLALRGELSFSSMDGIVAEGIELQCYPLEPAKTVVSGHLTWIHQGVRLRHPFALNPHTRQLTVMGYVVDAPRRLFSGPFQGSRHGNALTLVEEKADQRGGDCFEVDVPPQTLDVQRMDPATMGEFVFDFYSRFWLTYRRSLPMAIGGGVMTTDAGWGCMIRSGQSMLAEALSRMHLGRPFRLTDLYTHEHSDDIVAKYVAIVELFLDTPGAVFGIHRISQQGVRQRTPVGEWFGPSVLGHSLAGLAETPVKIAMLSDRLFPSSFASYPALALVPLRLGIGRQLDAKYVPVVRKCLESTLSVGIVGGLPQRSFYFLGFHGDSLLYLDPHVVQEALVDSLHSLKAMELHCQRPRLVPFGQIDSSMLVGFLLRSPHDIQQLRRDLADHHDIIDFAS